MFDFFYKDNPTKEENEKERIIVDNVIADAKRRCPKRKRGNAAPEPLEKEIEK